MTYECYFDFTTVQISKSKFTGKSGVIELTTDSELTVDEIESLKSNEELKGSIAAHLIKELNQKNIFSVTIKEVKLKK